MLVCLASIVRDATSYLGRYFSQADKLARYLSLRGDRLSVAVCEGDSMDSSFWWLKARAQHDPTLTVYKYDHYGPKFGSVDDPLRWKQGAMTWNYLFDAISSNPKHDAVVYIEADLLWEPNTIARLVDYLQLVPAVATMCFGRAGRHYDAWGHRADGIHFDADPPYHPYLVKPPVDRTKEGTVLLRIDSAGSCLAMTTEVANVCRFNLEDAMIGHDIYAKGFSLWIDPNLKVVHP